MIKTNELIFELLIVLLEYLYLSKQMNEVLVMMGRWMKRLVEHLTHIFCLLYALPDVSQSGMLRILLYGAVLAL